MPNREGTVLVKPDEWFGRQNDAHRAALMREARLRARKQCACIRIKVRDRFGIQVVATFEGRYWLIDPTDMVWPERPGVQGTNAALRKSARGWSG